jgi:glycosyltransferase involved in cell wall biosynthesis
MHVNKLVLERFHEFLNKIVALLQAAKFRIIEPTLLYLGRRKFSGQYQNYINPLVSIIIATYNRSDILVNRTIPSLLNQSYKNIEVVIVGDHCIDNTAEKVKFILDPRVKFYDLARRGKYPKNIKDRWFVQGTKPRNIGMELACGQWFVFMSDDDILYPNHVETLLRAAQKGGYEFISASYVSMRNGEMEIISALPFDANKPDLICGGMPAWLYRSYLKSFVWNIHSWRKLTNRPVDYDLVGRFYDRGVRMGFVDEVVGLVPVVEGTNTVGYLAALQADKLN